MAVIFDSSASSHAALTTLGSTSATQNVSATAPNLVALAAVYWAGTEDASGAAFTVTFGGVPMTEITDGVLNFDTGNECTLRFYELVGPPTGPQTVEATLDTNLGAGTLSLVSGTWSGVAAVGDAVTATGQTGGANLVVPSATASMFFNAFSCKPSAAGLKADQLAPPTGLAVATSTTGGTLAAGSYTWVATAINAAGETTASNQITKTTTGSTSSAALSCPAVLGATGWNIYRTLSGVTTLVTTISSGGALAYTDTGAAGTAATVPVANTANVYNQTVRASIAGTSSINPLLIGDADGAGTVDFTTSAPVDSTDQWAGIGVGLLGQGVAFDAVGAGDSGSGVTRSWSHLIAGNCVLVAASIAGLPSGASVAAQVGSTPMVPLGVAGDYAYSTTKTTYSTQQVELILFIFVFIWFTTVAHTTTVYSYSPSLFLFGLIGGPTGEQTVTLSTSAAANVAATSASYDNVSGFEPAVANGSYASGVTVPSTVPAARVVSVHAIKPEANTFTYESSENLAAAPTLTSVAASDLTQAKRAVVSTSAAEQILLLGDGPGDFSVTPVALMTSNGTTPTNTPDWGAAGVNLVPAVVELAASQSLEWFGAQASFTDFRSHAPSALRTWVVPATVATAASYGLPAQQWAQAVDSVLDYTIDWTEYLAGTGDTIVAAKFVPFGSTVSVVSASFTDTTCTGWLTGGTSGLAVPVTVHITTLYGRQDDRSFALVITQT